MEDYPLLFIDEEDEQRELERRYKKALAAAEEAARLLKEDYGAKKVWIFGSLTDQDRFNKWSDIDLAVQGVPSDRFYSAVGAVTGLISDFKVDLIDIDNCKDSLAKAVESEGQEI